ncbi:GDSL-type esterase/lipase family protein [Marinivivus vitaminiproducens]|uniref:GDSL-type esterase/lipase family protein n=1 Tax=Marinivivus vitaminiproducens TaxID=3035935 RepID=UPI0027A5EDF8|nr:GDSL-type esterase/lipase family protein [Geminicoccaceae bacterium SCSIO 64248]
MLRHLLLAGVAMLIGVTQPATAQDRPHWVTSWAASVHGPYPTGNPSAQPDLGFALPSPETGARDQTFRLTVRPTIWGPQARIRLSNAFGTKPVTFEAVHAGLQMNSAALVPGTNRPVTFEGAARVTVEPGAMAWSDPVALPFAQGEAADGLAGRKLAVSFRVVGASGPMTWHAKALNTSYLTAQGSDPDAAADADEVAFRFSTTSWFFLDAVDMAAPEDAFAVVAFGDSITDGTNSTLNGEDRWPDVLARRVHAAHGGRVAVVNAGIGGNQVVGPAEYGPDKPFPGGPSAEQRLDRDVLSLSGVGAVIWLEGTNDFSKNGNASAEAVKDGMSRTVGRIREALPGVRVIGATVTPALGSTSAAHGHEEQDAKRKELNAFIATSGLFDAVADFAGATTDPSTGELRAEMVPNSTVGGEGDKLHPNRAGYLAMGNAVPLEALLPKDVAAGK